jgi:hypothetical protein
MSYMWSPEEALRTAQPVAVVAVDKVDHRLRAQVWSGMLALNVVAWAAGLWFVATTIL